MAREKIALLVDDDVDFLEQQKMALESIGLQVHTAGNRIEAEKFLEDNTPDIAIIDLMMEELDSGFVLAHHIKIKTPDMPVIIVSAVTHERDVVFGAESMGPDKWIKADALLSKPVRFEQLKREIERLLP
jgi:DNA-binding response OmpR family regulator